MQNQALDPRRPSYWIRILMMTIALGGVVSSMGYFKSGKLGADPTVKTLLGADQPLRPAKIHVEGHRTSSNDR